MKAEYGNVEHLVSRLPVSTVAQDERWTADGGRANRNNHTKNSLGLTSAASSMSRLIRKMNHSSHPLSSWTVSCANGPPPEQGPLPPANPRGKRIPSHHLWIKLMSFGVTQKKRKPSRLPGNTIMKACTHTRYDASSNTKTTEMEIVDREREKEWLEQMDTILIFVCHTYLSNFG